jgi:chromosomal replication initiator protein
MSASKTKVINCNVIKDTVARYYNIRIDEFKSKKRNREISYPRQIAMYLCRELTDMSLPKIGDEFGGRDHTTVIHAYDKITEDIETNPETRRAVSELKRNISGN